MYPINHGILSFTGFEVVRPFVVHAPARLTAAERSAQLDRYRSTVLSLHEAPTIEYPRLAEYDEQYVLKMT